MQLEPPPDRLLWGRRVECLQPPHACRERLEECPAVLLRLYLAEDHDVRRPMQYLGYPRRLGPLRLVAPLEGVHAQLHLVVSALQEVLGLDGVLDVDPPQP